MIKILVANDDGIEAEGLKMLVRALSVTAKVYVAAPKTQQSAKSQSISLNRTVTGMETKMHKAEKAYVVEGSPADCVKFGLQKLKEQNIKIDYVISGINMGANPGTDIHYSGTVGAAMEGAMDGYHSIAMSVGSHKANNYDYICEMIPDILEMSQKLSTDVVLNVNTPDLPKWEIKGVKMTGIGNRSFSDKFTPVSGENGTFKYEGKQIDYSGSEEDIDLVHLLNGYATITPLLKDTTDYKTLRYMKRMLSEDMIFVFIDFQEKLLPAMYKNKELKNKVIKLAKCVKEFNMPAVITQQYTRGIGDTIPELRRVLSDPEHIEKLTFNAFDTASFENRLDEFTGRTVVLAGIEAHICLQQTALSFKERGYEVIVLKDCCSSRDKEDAKTAMNLLAAEGCTVTTYESVIYRLLGSSKNKHFKTISRIVK